MRKKTTTGRLNSTLAAISPPKSVPLFVENPASHTGSVYIVLVLHASRTRSR